MIKICYRDNWPENKYLRGQKTSKTMYGDLTTTDLYLYQHMLNCAQDIASVMGPLRKLINMPRQRSTVT